MAVLLGMLSSGPAAVASIGTEGDAGARSLYEGSWSTPVLGPDDQTRFGPLVPADQTLVYYADGCHTGRQGTTVPPGCVYGDPDSPRRVVMVGDSKVGRYFPALEEIARREGWALRTMTKSACAFVDEPDPTYPACDTFNEAVRSELAASPPDVVLTSGMRESVADGYVRTWEWLGAVGVDHVVALWDSPLPQAEVAPEPCIDDALASGLDLTTCAAELPETSGGNPSLRAAAEQVSVADYVSLRDWICPDSMLSPRCATVLGGVELYGLGSHLQPAFTSTLTDPIHQRLHERGVAAYRPSVDRIGGANRYETAALITRDVPAGGRVFVASGQNFPDALAAAALAGDGGAVLLTTAATLPSATRSALQRMAPAEIVVAGGDLAVSDHVVEDLRSYAPSVRRVAGPNRYATAALLSELPPVRPGGTVYVTTGTAFPDALAAAAQAGASSSPILLVQPDGIPSDTASALRELAPQRIIAVGGSTAISEKVLRALQPYATKGADRVGGTNRYETAALLARGTAPGSTLHVTSGVEFADALAAAPVAAARGGAVLLVPPDRVPSATADAVLDLSPQQLVLAGGAVAVAEDVKRALIRLVP
ncbi:hypothetical protein GCM10011366_27600 [Ornithinimicrobium tianjinense]|uniref:SGNH domain-containing protein n=2 Tax=Ornithinimicrobium tianjinense TaxID=1195761 RepID=A0A917BVE9_9MICO|nr:hypothetical protein GCM10011366_27600 [Ornithinimicrobium tianjinense]